MAEEINLALREHTTSIGFSMQLTRPMIDVVVCLHHFDGDYWKWADWRSIHTPRKAFGHLVVTSRSLQARGLLSPDQSNWNLTKAGHLVVDLLKEAGIYQERVKELGLE